MEMTEIGQVTHYFDDIHVATVELSEAVSLGDQLWFGNQEDGFEQVIEMLQIDDDNVETAEAGAVAGIHVHQPVEIGTSVYKKQ